MFQQYNSNQIHSTFYNPRRFKTHIYRLVKDYALYTTLAVIFIIIYFGHYILVEVQQLMLIFYQ